MFGFSGYLRWLMICPVIFNIIQATPSFTSSGEENNLVFNSLESPSSQTGGGFPQEKTTLSLDLQNEKRSEDHKNLNAESRGFKDVGWWPWADGIPPVRRSYFVPRLGKRAAETAAPNPQSGYALEMTPAEEDFLQTLLTQEEEDEEEEMEPLPMPDSDEDFLNERDTRSSYSFAPRLGKRTYSFSPRLGKRPYSFSPRLGKRPYSFSPRLGKRPYSFSPRLGKRTYSFSPRLGKRGYNFSPRLG